MIAYGCPGACAVTYDHRVDRCSGCEATTIEPPRVEVAITASAECWILTFACPWCPSRRGQPRTHIHGGGPLNEPPSLGHRVSHCHAPGAPSGYELVALPEPEPALPYGCPGGCAVVTGQRVDRCAGCTP